MAHLLLLRVTSNFDRNGEEWFEARAPEEIIVRFRAPHNRLVQVGDIISFSRGFLDGEAQLEVFSYKGHAAISVMSSDTKDLRDRRVVREVAFEDKTRIRLIATGEVIASGICPGGGKESSFDSIERFEGFVLGVRNIWLSSQFDNEQPRSLREAILDWTVKDAIPALKNAR